MFIIGWLSPEGKMYECKYMEHLAKADELILEYNYLNNNNKSGDEILLNNHWVQLTMMTFFGHKWCIFWKDPWKNHLTSEQKNFLKPYIEKFKDWIYESCLSDLKYEFEEEVIFD